MLPAAPIDPETLPLRDIHLPPAISWWPPALGWWLLLALILLSVGASYWLLQRKRRRRYRRLALQQLQQLQRQYQQQADDQQLLQALSRLMRQSAQLHYPGVACAGLIGEQWLQFLDRQLAGRPFSQGSGRVLARGPYLPQTPQIEVDSLLQLCRSWLRSLPLAPKPPRRRK